MKLLLYTLIFLSLIVRVNASQSAMSVFDNKGIEMIFVPSGKISMGATIEDALNFCGLVYQNSNPTICSESIIKELYAFTETELVTVQDFYMDRYEVSIDDYFQCVKADVCSLWAIENEYYSLLEEPELIIGMLPVSGISYYDSAIYCAWRQGRLPTEAEWQYAAVGSNEYFFPWGNDIKDIPANYYSEEFTDRLAVDSYDEGVSWTGIYNLSGNVAEWTSTRLLSTEADIHITKGGGYHSNILELVVWMRGTVDTLNPFSTTGFRCIRTTDPLHDL